MLIARLEANQRLSQAVVHNNLVFLTGQAGEQGNTVAEQTAYALSEIDRLLDLAGSEKSNILYATILLSDMAGFAEMNSVWDKWVDTANPPARATMQAQMVKPSYLVEVIVVAGV